MTLLLLGVVGTWMTAAMVATGERGGRPMLRRRLRCGAAACGAAQSLAVLRRRLRCCAAACGAAPPLVDRC